MLHIGAVGGSTLSVPVCVRESLSLSLWDTHSDSLVVEPTSKGESSSHIHQSGTETPGSLGWAPAAGQEEPPGPRAVGGSSCL